MGFDDFGVAGGGGGGGGGSGGRACVFGEAVVLDCCPSSTTKRIGGGGHYDAVFFPTLCKYVVANAASPGKKSGQLRINAFQSIFCRRMSLLVPISKIMIKYKHDTVPKTVDNVSYHAYPTSCVLQPIRRV